MFKMFPSARSLRDLDTVPINAHSVFHLVSLRPLSSRPSPCCCSGHLPKRLALWVVANPMLEADEAGVERVRKKVELGAEVIVTQPPLVWESFER